MRYKDMPGSEKSPETIIAITANSKAEVNDLVEKAMDAGGKTFNEPVDQGFI